MMDTKLNIGDFVSVDGIEHYVKYPSSHKKFINESGSMISYDRGISIIQKNNTFKEFDSFNPLQQKILMFFEGGKNKGEVSEENILLGDVDNIEFDFTFKRLIQERFLMRLFQKKDKFISKIEEMRVYKLL